MGCVPVVGFSQTAAVLPPEKKRCEHDSLILPRLLFIVKYFVLKFNAGVYLEPFSPADASFFSGLGTIRVKP
jgi:hypothetical protein